MKVYQADALRGQRALVTGGISGIGAAVCRALAMAGARVVVNYLSDCDEAEKLVNEIQADGGEAMAIQVDVSQEADVQRIFGDIIDTWGSIEILVANAGIQRDAAFHEMSLDQWNMDIGHVAVWLASHASDYPTGTTIYADGGMTLYPGFREGG